MANNNILSNKNILLLEGDNTPLIESLTGPAGSLYVEKDNGTLWIQGTGGTSGSWNLVGNYSIPLSKTVWVNEDLAVSDIDKRIFVSYDEATDWIIANETLSVTNLWMVSCGALYNTISLYDFIAVESPYIEHAVNERLYPITSSKDKVEYFYMYNLNNNSNCFVYKSFINSLTGNGTLTVLGSSLGTIVVENSRVLIISLCSCQSLVMNGSRVDANLSDITGLQICNGTCELFKCKSNVTIDDGTLTTYSHQGEVTVNGGTWINEGEVIDARTFGGTGNLTTDCINTQELAKQVNELVLGTSAIPLSNTVWVNQDLTEDDISNRIFMSYYNASEWILLNNTPSITEPWVAVLSGVNDVVELYSYIYANGNGGVINSLKTSVEGDDVASSLAARIFNANIMSLDIENSIVPKALFIENCKVFGSNIEGGDGRIGSRDTYFIGCDMNGLEITGWNMYIQNVDNLCGSFNTSQGNSINSIGGDLDFTNSSVSFSCDIPDTYNYTFYHSEVSFYKEDENNPGQGVDVTIFATKIWFTNCSAYAGLDTTKLILDGSAIVEMVNTDSRIIQVRSGATLLTSNSYIEDIEVLSGGTWTNNGGTLNPSGFTGNLDDTVINTQLLAERVDQLVLGGGSLISTTYDDLITTIANDELKVGSQYLITDFQTVHYILDNNTSRTGDIQIGELEPIIVKAVTTNTLDKEAISTVYPKDIIYYNVTSDTRDIAFYDITPNPVSGYKGQIYFRHDTIQNVSTWYDFRNVKYRRWAVSATEWVSEDSYTAKDVTEYDGILYKCNINHTGITTTPDLDSTNWIKWLDKTLNWSWTSNKDEFNIAEINTSNLIMSDEEDFYTFGAYYSQVKDVQIGKMDLDVALEINSYTIINNIVFNTTDELDTCFSNKFGYYCGNSTIGSNFSNNVIGDNFGGNTIGTKFYSNTIGNDFSYNTIGNNYTQNQIVNSFNTNAIGDNFSSNNIGESFASNTIVYNFISNTIGNLFNTNTIGKEFGNNTIGDNFGYNTIGDYFNNNTIGNYSNTNTIGNYFSHNNIENNFNSNTIGHNFASNTIGNTFNSNTIGNNFGYNTVGNAFTSNIISAIVTFNYENLNGGTFTVGDTITDDNTGATAIILSDDGVETMTVKSLTGQFVINDTISSGVITATLTSIETTFSNSQFTNNRIADEFNFNLIGTNFKNNQIANYFANNTIADNFGTDDDGFVFGNVIGDYFQNNTTLGVFSDNKIGNMCGSTPEEGQKPNTFGSNFVSNNIGNWFFSNIVGTSFNKNVIGHEFNGNNIGDNFYSNTIKNSFRLNVIGNDFSYNTVGDSFYSNTIGYYFAQNIIGYYCHHNTIGNENYSNVIRNFFHSNTIIAGDFISNDIRDGFASNTIEAGFKYNIIGYGFISNITEQNFRYNTISYSVTADFSTATHVYGDYPTTLYKDKTDGLKLSYMDGGMLQITDITD